MKLADSLHRSRTAGAAMAKKLVHRDSAKKHAGATPAPDSMTAPAKALDPAAATSSSRPGRGALAAKAALARAANHGRHLTPAQKGGAVAVAALSASTPVIAFVDAVRDPLTGLFQEKDSTPKYEVRDVTLVDEVEGQGKTEQLTPAQKNAYSALVSLAKSYEEKAQENPAPETSEAHAQALVQQEQAFKTLVDIASPPPAAGTTGPQVQVTANQEIQVNFEGGRQVAITPAGLDAVAQRFEQIGIPLTDEGISTFLTQRGLSSSTSVDAQVAGQLATALAGHQVIYDLPATLTPQQQAAKGFVEALGPQGRAELRQYLNLTAPPAGNLGVQQQALGNEIIDTALLDGATAAFKGRGLDLPQQTVDGPQAQALFQSLKSVGERPADEAGRADWYKRVVQSQSGAWREGVNEINVVNLRGYDVDSGRHPNATNTFDDTLAFIWKGDDGALHVREFRATADPGLPSGGGAPDVDGDGVGDIAHARAGQYSYRLGTHKDRYGAGNPNLNVPVDRDTNHNLYIELEEAQASAQRGDVGTGINIHWGPGYGDTVGPYSAGCQVAQMSYDQFRQEITPLLELNAPGDMLLTIVDMSRVA